LNLTLVSELEKVRPGLGRVAECRSGQTSTRYIFFVRIVVYFSEEFIGNSSCHFIIGADDTEHP
jgi:hypothetical protein